jgi:DHA1 family tetracycline resistance protein-like MFS transporter
VRRSPLLPIFLIVFVDILGFTMILPLLPFYAQTMGASDFTIGLLLSSYALCQLVAGPILGKLSDHYGRKPLLILSQAGTLAGFILLASTRSLWLVFVSRILDGITAGNLSLAQAYISDVSLPEKRAQSFGVIGIAFGVGFTIGPGISGELARISYVAPILAACVLSFTSIMCTTFLLPRKPPLPEGLEPHVGPAPNEPERASIFKPGLYVAYFKRPGMGRLFFQFLCFALSFSTFFAGFALFGQARLRYGPTEIGQVLLVIGILGIILQGRVLGILVKRFGESRLAGAGFLMSGVSAGLLSLARNTPSVIATAGGLSVGSGMVRPAVTSLISRKAGRHEQGVILGITQSLQSVAQIVSPPIATGLIGLGLLNVWACLAGAFMLVGLILSLRSAE